VSFRLLLGEHVLDDDGIRFLRDGRRVVHRLRFAAVGLVHERRLHVR
jgi:hypothetical protein